MVVGWSRWCAVFAGTATLAALLPPAPARAWTSTDPTVGAVAVRRDGAELRVRRVAVAGGTVPRLATTSTASPMDLDRDGRDEIVVGAYLLDGGYGMIVNYSGLPQRDYITAPIPSSTRPNFGDTVTSGDFDGDGYADLAISNQGERVGTTGSFAGGVWIFYGGATGLDLTAPQHLNQDVDGVPGVMEASDDFGAALAAGDLNADGRDDLAIGAPGDRIAGLASAGSVTTFFGGPTGLTKDGVQLIDQDTAGVPNKVGEYEGFGAAVAIGDMTGDGYADLAAGAPAEDAPGHPDAGLVMLLHGGPTGVTGAGATSFLGSDHDISVIGEFLSIADIDGDGDGDLVAGAPRAWIGYLVYVPGVPAGMDVARARVISMDTPGVPGDSLPYVDDSPHTHFGEALSTGDVTGDGRADLLTGAPSYDAFGLSSSGGVFLIPGTPDGLTGAGSVMLARTVAPSRGANRPTGPVQPPVAHGRMGEQTSILNLDGTGPLDLLAATSSTGDSGLVVELKPQLSIARGPVAGRPSMPKALLGLLPGRSWTGSELGAYVMGHTLLHR